jgi:hypothetical protein
MPSTAASQLDVLRRRLGQLLARRRWSRRGSAAAAIVLAVLWGLAALFLIDLVFEADRAYRAAALAIAIVAVGWAGRRFAAPWLGWGEDVLDMALLIERQQRIDSDLVAALQFEWEEAPRWGSPRLERAVLDYVGEFGKELKIDDGVDWAPLKRRGVLIVASLAPLALGAALFPGHTAAFFDRLLLGPAHYPTRTRIERIVVGQTVVPPTGPSPLLRAPQGQPLKFEVQATGILPRMGRVRVSAIGTNLRTELDLVALHGRRGVYVATLPSLTEPTEYQLFLGDAWTDPEQVDCLNRPVVSVALKPTMPAYAAQDSALGDAGGQRQLVVLEGSRVQVRLRCLNKRLRGATLSLGSKSYALAAEGPDGQAWSFDPDGTPLARVVEPVTLSLQVEDEDGLSLERPWQGSVRAKVDRPPQVMADMVTRRVLPAARPTLWYEAADDYGIACLRLYRQVVRASDGSEMEEGQTDVVLDGPPERSRRGRITIDLAPLDLRRGDQLTFTLEATDFRGDEEGHSTTSEPVVLEVTDERGVLAGMIESDQPMESGLDSAIDRQDMGDAP